MKTKFLLFLILVILFTSLTSCELRISANVASSSHTSPSYPSQKRQVLNHDTMSAVWISQFDMHSVYTKNSRQREIEDYTKKVKKIVSNLKSIGINTVFFQLRPNGDSIYPSELFPPSRYATGAYGREFSYDPFEIFLREAHAKQISVHAWINPLRCMREEDIAQIPEKFPVASFYLKNYGRYIVNVGGTLYLDPAYPAVREHICLGVAEILEKYEVDGVHIDDYFYPTQEPSFDAEAYLSFGAGLTLEDFRRQNVNLLVSELYSTVKSSCKELTFGVSPAGNTSANYNLRYADVAKWCSEEGYIDYVCPQVYFGFEHGSLPYASVCDEFSDMIKLDGIRLIIGMTLGKAADASCGVVDKWAGEGAREWIENRDVLARQYKYATSLPNCAGVSFFSYQYFFDALDGTQNPLCRKECEGLIPLLKN